MDRPRLDQSGSDLSGPAAMPVVCDHDAPPSTMSPEVAIVRRACQRDSAAFGQLYQTHFDRIYHDVYYRVRSVEESEDITGQVFLIGAG